MVTTLRGGGSLVPSPSQFFNVSRRKAFLRETLKSWGGGVEEPAFGGGGGEFLFTPIPLPQMAYTLHMCSNQQGTCQLIEDGAQIRYTCTCMVATCIRFVIYKFDLTGL